MNTTYHHSLLNGLDDFVEEQLQRWKGVGVAVAVIHKDEVILQKDTVIATWSPSSKLRPIHYSRSVPVPKPSQHQQLPCLSIRTF